MNLLLGFIYFLILIIFALAVFGVMQIKLAGMNVKDFCTFIQANDILDRLYSLSKRYEKMSYYLGKQIRDIICEHLFFLMFLDLYIAKDDKRPGFYNILLKKSQG